MLQTFTTSLSYISHGMLNSPMISFKPMLISLSKSFESRSKNCTKYLSLMATLSTIPPATNVSTGRDDVSNPEEPITQTIPQPTVQVVKVVKVADFGVARVQAQSGVMTAEIGTYCWMAPEEHRQYVKVTSALCEERIVWREDGVPLIQSRENPKQYS